MAPWRASIKFERNATLKGLETLSRWKEHKLRLGGNLKRRFSTNVDGAVRVSMDTTVRGPRAPWRILYQFDLFGSHGHSRPWPKRQQYICNGHKRLCRTQILCDRLGRYHFRPAPLRGAEICQESRPFGQAAEEPNPPKVSRVTRQAELFELVQYIRRTTILSSSFNHNHDDLNILSISVLFSAHPSHVQSCGRLLLTYVNLIFSLPVADMASCLSN